MALNVNSPTVQAMMQNTPQGMGNMPVYFGSTPTIATETPQTAIPFPSPKEMLTSAGQQMVYAPAPMQMPSNYVGGYNPGFNAAFAGYTNPYMGYGYSGFGMGGYPVLDEETKLTLQLAQENGLTYEEQINMESVLYKKIVRVVGNNTGHSEEEIQQAESVYDVKEKYPKRQEETYYRKPVQNLHIKIQSGDTVVAEINDAAKVGYISPIHLDQMQMNAKRFSDAFKQQAATLFSKAPERRADAADLIDFFNEHAGGIMMNDLIERSEIQSKSMVAQMYSKEKFGALLKNNGRRNRSQENAVERYVGRYGVMPDGRPVSPGHDPSIAECFAYNPAKGSIDITAPGFMKDKLESARMRFIQSLESQGG